MKKKTVQEEISTDLGELSRRFSCWAEEVSPQVRETLDHVATDAQKLVKKLSKELPKDSSKMAGMGLGILLVMMLGYRMGKNRRAPVLQQAKETSEEVSQNFSPFFKFLKLWMFYRLSV